MDHLTSENIKQALIESKYPVALTGAGISVASSLPTLQKTFDGIPIQKILERSFFERQTAHFYGFYREILRWRDCEPNTAHLTLAANNVRIITQNIDGLHQKAGSRKVIEIHGNLRRLICENCNAHYPSHLAQKETLPKCRECSSILKPDIVLYAEPIHHWEQAVAECLKADLILVIGTSLTASPANTLPALALEGGAKQIVINTHADQLLHF